MLFIVVCVFCLHCPCSVVVARFVRPFFIVMSCCCFCLFVDHLNKSIVFGTLVYHFNNTISIFVTIRYCVGLAGFNCSVVELFMHGYKNPIAKYDKITCNPQYGISAMLLLATAIFTAVCIVR